MTMYTNEVPMLSLVCRECAGTEYADHRYVIPLDRVNGGGASVHPDVPGGENHNDFEVIRSENIPAGDISGEYLLDWASVYDHTADVWAEFCTYCDLVPGSGVDPASLDDFWDSYLGTYASEVDFYEKKARERGVDLSDRDVVEWGYEVFGDDYSFHDVNGKTVVFYF